MKRISLLILLFCVFNLSAQTKAEKINDLSLNNLFRIDEGVYRCEQPDNNAFKALKKYGVAEVLNLRNWHSDNSKASGTGLVLHRVKMDAHNVNDKDIITALKIIKNRKGPIIIHCKHGSDRTGVVCALYRIIFNGFTKEQAIQELKSGFGFHPIYSNIPRYIEEVDISYIKKEIGL